MAEILIIKLGALGDVLRTTCILPGLKTKYPGAVIEWLTLPNAAELLVDNSWIDLVWVKDDHVLKKLQKKTYDLVISLDDDEWPSMVASSLSVRELFGAFFTNGEIGYTDSSARWFDMSLISRQGKMRADQLKKKNKESYPALLCNMLGIEMGRPNLVIAEADDRVARRFFDKNFSKGHQIVGLNTGAGPRWRFKKLSAVKTVELSNLLVEKLGVEVLLFGGPEEQERNKWIKKKARYQIFDAGGDRSILEFAALIGRCDALVTSDSLAMHIGYVLRVNVAAFFGPTSAAEIELFDNGIKIAPTMSCLCCYKTDCDYEQTCMDNIQVRSIYESVRMLLEGR
jgi:heptosyltransferase-2